MNTLTYDLWEEGRALYPKWREHTVYLHWCDLIVLNVESADDGNFFVTEFNDRFVLIIVKQGTVLAVFDVEAGDASGVFYQVSQNLRAFYEEDKTSFFALRRAAITFEAATGIKFDTPEKIKDIKFTKSVPVLLLAGIRDILCDPQMRNENLSIKSSVYSKKNYRRQMLKALNPLIKEGQLKFRVVDFSEARLDFLGKDKTPVLNFCHINTVEQTIFLNRSSTLFSFIAPMDKETYTYKEFSEFFATVVEDVKILLEEQGYISPSNELIYQFIFLTGSRILGELTSGGGDATVLRHYITLSEALVFLKHNFSIKQILRVYSLYMPVDQLPNFKDAPDEWLEVIDREYVHPIIKQLLQNQS